MSMIATPRSMEGTLEDRDQWRVLAGFPTLEKAEESLSELRSRGGDGELAIGKDGLCILSTAAEQIPNEQDTPSQRRMREIVGTLDREISDSAKFDLIFEAELLQVPADCLLLARQLWKEFITQYRDTNDRKTLLAVACAIRKYVSLIPSADLPELVYLLEPGHSGHLPIELEVTVGKMIVRKLTANPPTIDNAYPELAAQLQALADDYLKDRLLPRQYVGAAALDACLALVMLRAACVSEFISRLRNMKSRWFVELISDESEEVISEILARRPKEESGPTVKALREFVIQLDAARPKRANADACQTA